MIRPAATELALFLTPFFLYALFLLATRKGLFDPAHWPLTRVASLVIAALLLMIGSFVALSTFGGSPPGSVYIPPHEGPGGEIVPGETRKRDP